MLSINQAPANLLYHASYKSYLPQNGFIAHFINADVVEYLNWISHNPQQQDVIAHDYQMQNGQLTLNTRACLAQYLLQELQVNIRDINISPEAQQLVLSNIDAVKPWLFEEKS